MPCEMPDFYSHLASKVSSARTNYMRFFDKGGTEELVEATRQLGVAIQRQEIALRAESLKFTKDGPANKRNRLSGIVEGTPLNIVFNTLADAESLYQDMGPDLAGLNLAMFLGVVCDRDEYEARRSASFDTPGKIIHLSELEDSRKT